MVRGIKSRNGGGNVAAILSHVICGTPAQSVVMDGEWRVLYDILLCSLDNTTKYHVPPSMDHVLRWLTPNVDESSSRNLKENESVRALVYESLDFITAHRKEGIVFSDSDLSKWGFSIVNRNGAPLIQIARIKHQGGYKFRLEFGSPPASMTRRMTDALKRHCTGVMDIPAIGAQLFQEMLELAL